MKLVLTNRILTNGHYREELEKIRCAEENRIFCRHDIEHFMNVARITLIRCAEKGIEADPDVIYSAALLHDIGRYAEYTEGIPHDEAGVKIASEILEETDCPQDVKAVILSITGSHRRTDNEKNSLEYIFHWADKKSRMCFCCQAQDECNWHHNKRNMDIEV